MTKLSVRLIGEDSSRILETAGENETVNGLAKQLASTGYLLGKMKASERVPEPQEVAILASQVKWIAILTEARRN